MSEEISESIRKDLKALEEQLKKGSLIRSGDLYVNMMQYHDLHHLHPDKKLYMLNISGLRFDQTMHAVISKEELEFLSNAINQLLKEFPKDDNT